jgi:hypothetical protein
MKKWTEYERDRKIRQAGSRPRALLQQQLASPLSRAPTDLEIDRSTQSTLIGSTLGNSPRRVLSSSSISPTPPLPTQIQSRSTRPDSSPTEEQGQDDTNESDEDDQDSRSIVADETEEIRQWRQSLEFIASTEAIDTNLPMISNDNENEDEWQTSVMDTIHSKSPL